MVAALGSRATIVIQDPGKSPEASRLMASSSVPHHRVVWNMRSVRFLLAMLFIASASARASAEGEKPAAEAPSRPGFNERLNQALGSEGGVQVYMDAEGNVGTIIDVPGGDRKVLVQPPQSPSINLGPPLQLPPRPLVPGPAQDPHQSATPQFPRKADQVPRPRQ